jgi:uncharacterized protein YdeI (YjbR/CyaY-like superfamily)
MTARPIVTLEVGSRAEWREWLAGHHDTVAEIWLVLYKRHTGVVTLSYTDAVEEALCYGWIDSLVRRLNDDRYAQKFSPRKANSRWSTTNTRRYADLLARGLIAAPGLARAPSGPARDAPRPSLAKLPDYFEQALRANPAARRTFEQLAPSYRRNYIAWLEAAKRPETRAKRLREALELLAAGKKLPLM